MKRAWPVIGGLALVGLTFWAFAPRTDSNTAAPGVRVDSNAAYNPVTAGEPLPDGFRQLLARDAIAPIYNPAFASADEMAWLANTQVIGVAIGNEAKAYPVSFLNRREMVIDEIEGEPILVTW